MLLKKTPLEGAVEIESLPKKDKRGSFVRFFCQKEHNNTRYSKHIVTNMNN